MKKGNKDSNTIAEFDSQQYVQLIWKKKANYLLVWGSKRSEQLHVSLAKGWIWQFSIG